MRLPLLQAVTLIVALGDLLDADQEVAGCAPLLDLGEHTHMILVLLRDVLDQAPLLGCDDDLVARPSVAAILVHLTLGHHADDLDLHEPVASLLDLWVDRTQHLDGLSELLSLGCHVNGARVYAVCACC